MSLKFLSVVKHIATLCCEIRNFFLIVTNGPVLSVPPFVIQMLCEYEYDVAVFWID